MRSIKKQILKMLKEEYQFETEKEFNNYMKNDYEPVDNTPMIDEIMGIFESNVFYEYVYSGDFSHGLIYYYSPKLERDILISYDTSFSDMNLNEIIKTMKYYIKEGEKIEKRIT